MKDFVKFLDKKNVIAVATSFVIGSSAQKFIDGLISELILPFIPEELQDTKAGRITKLFITMMLVLYFVYIIIRVSERYIGFT